MAIRVLPFYALVVRFDASRVTSSAGWRFLMQSCDRSRNFDGELIVFGAMNYNDIQDYLKALNGFGFREPSSGEDSDMCLFSAGYPMTSIPNWLSVVDVEFFSTDEVSCQAWKLKDSQVYDLLDFHQEVRLPRKGYECDWPPLIGRI